MPRLTAIRKQALDEMMKVALFEATVSVLSKHGVGGLTMDRVAAAADMAKGNLYRYFSSKRELLEFVHAKILAPVFSDLEEMGARRQPALEKLEWQLRRLLEHVAKHAHVHRLLFDDEAAIGILHSSERRTVEAVSKCLSAVFEQGIAEGVFRPAAPLMLAKMYIGLCKAVLQTRPDLQESGQRDEVYRLIMNTFLNGIATKKSRVG